MASQKRKWVGNPPATCDLCNATITNAFVDGSTYEGATRGMPGGRWACMCLPCHGKKGVGLGEGAGQQYELQMVPGTPNPRMPGVDYVTTAWVKVRG